MFICDNSKALKTSHYEILLKEHTKSKKKGRKEEKKKDFYILNKKKTRKMRETLLAV